MKRLLILLCLLPSLAFGQVCCPSGNCGPQAVPGLSTGGWQAVPIQRRAAMPVQRQAAVAANPAIVRVVCRYRVVKEGRQVEVTGIGSGTIFDRRDGAAYVVTCEHGPKQGMFVLAGGREYGATIVRQDALWDVIVLRINDPGIKPLPIADTAPMRGDTVWVAGWGLGTYRHTRGQLVGFSAPSRSTPFELAEISAVCRQGDSGGPMLGPRGRIVGVISGTDDRTTTGCGFHRLRRILRAVLPPYPRRAGVIVPKPIVVVPVKPSPVTPAPNYDALVARIAALEKRLAKLEAGATIGPQGPRGQAGPQGEQGEQGLTGGAGPTPAVDIKAIIAQLPPVRVEWETLDGTVLSQEKPLGEPLRFKSIEIDARRN